MSDLLAELQRRCNEAEEALGRARDELELRVAQRTDELRVANERLTAELLERRHAEGALLVAKQAAEAASRAKTTFLAHMSHEIRTPMNAILGYTQLLQRDPRITPKQQSQLEVIERSGEHLLALVNDVLQMSKIEAGHRDIVRGDVDLKGLIDDVERMFRLRADAAHLAFAVHRAPEVPRYIVSDEGKLRQVLVNLVGNAVKFTREGHVSVRLQVQPGVATGGRDRLVVAVADTGPGISPAELEGLFRPFAQAYAGAQVQGGTGLGLALSRELAVLLGGDITVASRVRVGSVFTLTVPLEVDEKKTTERPPHRAGRAIGLASPEKPPRILVADDDEDSRSWLKQLLDQLGFEVHTASNGLEAVARCAQWVPHLVLMDMNMPVMDGYAAIRAIRALTPSEAPAERRTAIVAITAVAFADGRDAIFAAGADGWLCKPCREADLLDEIAERLGVEYRYAPDRSPSSHPRWLPVARPSSGPLPSELCARLRAATRIADYQGLTDLIQALPADHALLAEELLRLAEGFAYEEIERVLAARPQPSASP